MPLWCTTCHTEWDEQYLMEWAKCPFTDCIGTLRRESPVLPAPREPKPKKTYPLLDAIGATHDQG